MMLQNINIVFKIFLFVTIVFSNIQICSAPCSFDDCEAGTAAADTTGGMYDNFCDETKLFKPYVKIYKSRGGGLLEKAGPKLYPIPENAIHDDIYVCINGPAWLYRAKHLPLGVVFHKPEFRVYTHECQFYNGKKGPESHTEQERLMAILLMGDAIDYRRPSMQLFTAPLYNQNMSLYENVTSVMTFGPNACTIERGTKENKMLITIQPTPTEPNSFCKLAYQNVDQIFGLANAPSDSAASSDDSTPKGPLIKQLLKNDVALKQMPCSKNDVIPKMADPSYIEKLVESKTKDIEKQKAKFITDLASYKLSTASQAILDDSQINDTAQANLEAANTTILSPDSTPQAIEDAKKAKKVAEDAVAKNVRITDAQDTYCKLLKTSATAPDTMDGKYGIIWDDALAKSSLPDSDAAQTTNLVEQLKAAKVEWDTAKKAFEAAKANGGVPTETEITDKKTKKEAYVLILEKIKTALTKYSESYALAFAKSREAEEVYKQCQRAVERIENPSLPEIKLRGLVITIPQKYTVTVESITTEIDNCSPLPSLEATCKAVKPSKTRACQFLKSIVEKPEICLQEEVNEDNTSANLTEISAETTTKKQLGETNAEILDLIKDIYDEACTHFFPENTFADRITRVFKCYLMKPVRYEGAGMNENNTSNELSGPKTNAHMVTQILEALRVCRDEKRKLKFRKDPTSGEGKKDQRYQYWNNSMWIDVHLHSEQADKEFAFNFAIDMHFKMFTTVMGLCMPSHGYNNRNALISSMFYATYSRIFYAPLKLQWTNPKDNRIFNLLLGNFKNQNGDLYANHCMEASFIHGGDTDYRPPRYLFVNGNTEANFFTSGRLANKNHKYMSAFK